MSQRELSRRREGALAGQPARDVRPLIRESWLRSRRAGIRPDAYLPPVDLDEDEVVQRRERHPLATTWAVLCAALQTTGEDHILFLSDADGHLLWVRGDAAVRGAAERVHLVPGASWSERTAGTSGVGTALALQRPAQVFGPEHFLSAATQYACTAAPIRDPASGSLLGAVNLTGGLDVPPRLAMSLLLTAARLAEARLRTNHLRQAALLRERYADRLTRRVGTYAALVRADGTVLHANRPRWLPSRVDPILEPGCFALPDGRVATAESLAPSDVFLVTAQEQPDDVIRFDGLDRPRARLQLADVNHHLTRRHSEVVAILLAHPGGLNAADLAREVYGPAARPATLRAEISRLRSVLGHRLRSDPYRIVGATKVDFLEAGLDDPGTLLPGSLAPGIRDLRIAHSS